MGCARTPDRDRVGLGWRSELAASIWAHLEQIDVLELIADDLFDAPRARLRTLRRLGESVPLTLHGVGLGLASREPVEHRRLERLARVIDAVRPESWSEHLAFVRGGGREIGHLAAPPRVEATIVGAARNLTTARRVVGSMPLVENVATLVEPPGSVQPEDEWVRGVLEQSGAELLLDLHNLYANAQNFGFDAEAWLANVPIARVATVHLAGGRWLSAHGVRRRLDDHLHDVPAPVFRLLEHVAARAPRPLTVVLERDGAYPPFEMLLAELAHAREALRRGRERQRATEAQRRGLADVLQGREVSAAGEPRVPREPSLRPLPDVPSEALLAAAYTDATARARFLDTRSHIDRAGLELAAAGFARKRQQAAAHAARQTPLARLRAWAHKLRRRWFARRAGRVVVPGLSSHGPRR